MLYNKIYNLVIREFDGITDKGGNPYIDHLVSVASRVDTIEEKVTALLHDIKEDRDYTSDMLRAKGVSENIIEAVDILTRRRTETYMEYINRVVSTNNLIAIRVKKSDLEDNMDLGRIDKCTEEDHRRVFKRYIPAYTLIVNRLEELEFSENLAERVEEGRLEHVGKRR